MLILSSNLKADLQAVAARQIAGAKEARHEADIELIR